MTPVSDPVSPLGEALRQLERTTASISANMDRQLEHFGIAGTTEEEIDGVLAEEAHKAQTRPVVPTRRRRQIRGPED